MDDNLGNSYQNNNNEEKRKVGRPQKIDPKMMLKLKQVYSGTKANKRHLQNHYYQMCSVMPTIRYNSEHPIDYFKQTVFTELGRTEQMLEEFFSKEEAEQYIINMAIEICELAKKEKLTSRIVERIVRQDRQELKKKLKSGE